MTTDPNIDLKIDNNLNGILVATCRQCKRKLEKKFIELSPGKEIKCSCGFTFSISGDGLRSAQRGLDDLKRSLDNFGK